MDVLTNVMGVGKIEGLCNKRTNKLADKQKSQLITCLIFKRQGDNRILKITTLNSSMAHMQ